MEIKTKFNIYFSDRKYALLLIIFQIIQILILLKILKK